MKQMPPLIKAGFFTQFTLLLCILSPVWLSAQLSWDLEISPLYRLQIHDGSELQLPVRTAQAGLNWSGRTFELHLNTDLQTRWQDPDMTEAGLREFYLHAYPFFGEVRLGRQILAWGYADQNNPTDNINPYNYYYLFGLGIERKEAVNALSVTVDLNVFSLQAEINEHKANIFPWDEADFPIQFPPEADPRGRSRDPEQPWESGLRLRFPAGGWDLSLSYRRGYDKTATPVLLTYLPPNLVFPPDNILFGYRRTQTLGMDAVAFILNATLRAEAAWFRTENEHNTDAVWNYLISSRADYLQYILQLEYDLPLELSFSAQYLGHSIQKAEGVSLNDLRTALMDAILNGAPLNLTESDMKTQLQIASGSPLHSFLESAAVLSLSRSFLNDRLNLKGAGIINLKESGQIYSMSADYYLNDWLQLELFSSLIRSASAEDTNFFKMMEDFSHIGLGLSMQFASF